MNMHVNRIAHTLLIALLLGGTALASPQGEGKELLREPTDEKPKKFQPASKEEHEAMIAKAKAKRDDVAAGMKLELSTIETPHFIIFTDWDRREHNFLKTNLELAYNLVSRQFDISPKENVFVGKLPVFMFAKQSDFKKFAKEYDGFDVPDTVAGYYQGNNLGQGSMCMWKPDIKKAGGNVRQAEVQWASTLVHEFTHAFIARYRTNAFIPRWLNEGVAEVIASRQFPEPGVYPYVRNRQNVVSVKRLLSQTELLRGEDYPVVRTLVETMIVGDRKAFLKFFDDIKDGVSVEEALQKHYKTDPDGLEEAWKKYIKTAK